MNHNSFHPTQTKSKYLFHFISKHTMDIVPKAIIGRFNELNLHLLQQKHPEIIINYSSTKLFGPAQNIVKQGNLITFARTYNANNRF